MNRARVYVRAAVLSPALAILLVPNVSFAWTSVTVGMTTGRAYIESGSLSKEQASTGAQKKCEVRNEKCREVASFTGNRFVVIARSEKGVIAAHDAELKKAEADALKACNIAYGSCRIDDIAWDGRGRVLAIGKSTDFSHASINDDLNAAMTDAMIRCKMNSKRPEQCEVEGVNKGQFFSAAAPLDAGDEPASYSVYLSGSKAESDLSVIDLCEKTYKKKCRIIEKYSFQSAARMPEPAQGSQRRRELASQK